MRNYFRYFLSHLFRNTIFKNIILLKTTKKLQSYWPVLLAYNILFKNQEIVCPKIELRLPESTKFQFKAPILFVELGKAEKHFLMIIVKVMLAITMN